jgi:hypothetical protein
MRSPGHSVLAVVLVVTSPAARRIQRCLTWKTRSLASFSFLLHWLSYFGHANDPEQRACQSAPFTRERLQVQSLQRPSRKSAYLLGFCVVAALKWQLTTERDANMTQRRVENPWTLPLVCSRARVYDRRAFFKSTSAFPSAFIKELRGASFLRRQSGEFSRRAARAVAGPNADGCSQHTAARPQRRRG